MHMSINIMIKVYDGPDNSDNIQHGSQDPKSHLA